MHFYSTDALQSPLLYIDKRGCWYYTTVHCTAVIPSVLTGEFNAPGDQSKQVVCSAAVAAAHRMGALASTSCWGVGALFELLLGVFREGALHKCFKTTRNQQCAKSTKLNFSLVHFEFTLLCLFCQLNILLSVALHCEEISKSEQR